MQHQTIPTQEKKKFGVGPKSHSDNVVAVITAFSTYRTGTSELGSSWGNSHEQVIVHKVACEDVFGGGSDIQVPIRELRTREIEDRQVAAVMFLDIDH